MTSPDARAVRQSINDIMATRLPRCYHMHPPTLTCACCGFEVNGVSYVAVDGHAITFYNCQCGYHRELRQK